MQAGVSGRTVNMETGVLRRMLKRAKVWNGISEDVKTLPERQGAVAKVLPAELKRKLFETAASRPEWMVAHCAAVLAVSTTCRGVEIRNLRWQDVDLFSRIATIRRSKTVAGHRTIPLNRKSEVRREIGARDLRQQGNGIKRDGQTSPARDHRLVVG